MSVRPPILCAWCPSAAQLRPVAWAAAQACLWTAAVFGAAYAQTPVAPATVPVAGSSTPSAASGASPGSVVPAASAPAAGASAAASASAAPGSISLRLDRDLSPLPRGPQAPPLPGYLRAQRIDAKLGVEATAEGQVEFRRGGTVLDADRVDYRYGDDLVHARGHVQISRDGAVYRGPELEVHLDTFKGWFANPSFDFARNGAGGDAERVEFIDGSRSRALRARYTSCPRDDGGTAAWQLTADQVDLNFDANEGIASGAVLRFLGVPILAAPRLSFPITDERKSGWLPPTVNIDNRSGLDVSVPYYWNIAPNRDATIAPRLLARRGPAADMEFRYLEPRFGGQLGLDLLPHDREAGRTRYAWRAQHDGTLDSRWDFLRQTRLRWNALGVSDDDWWKDFPRSTGSLTPRLLEQSADLEKPLHWGPVSGQWYARLSQWQVLQSTTDPIFSPYQRSPQLGVSGQAALPAGTQLSFESEFNRFTLGRLGPTDGGRPEGSRWHAAASISRPWREPGWWVVPQLSFNTAYYDTQGRPSASRSVPTLSVDAGATFERRMSFLGRDLRQVLEPRLHYVRTPFRAQSQLPNYDSAGKDFNFTSIYSDNAWSGVDRISDSHQLTFGATTRLVRPSDGAEVLRLGLVQRVLFSPQVVTPDDTNPLADAATPLTRRLSDVLLIGSTQVVPRWNLEGTVRYNADTQRTVRSVLGARYDAGDFRAFSASYRYTRGQSEQIDVGWQWPVARITGRSNGCNGRLYSVGRVNYSMLDSRITDSLLGLEFDAGCWIGRIVAERVSTGRTEATTRLMLQLELVGLSRLGSNPLRVLKDNIPGYRLLREERGSTPATSTTHD